MEVYVDIVVLQGFIINLFLLTITMQLMKLKYSKKRLYVSAFLAALYTLTIVIDETKFLTNMPMKIFVAFLLVYIILKEYRINLILKGLGIFVFLSITLAGLTFFFTMLQNEYTVLDSYTIDNNSMKYIILSIMIVYLVLNRIAEYLRERGVISNFYYDMEIGYKGHNVKVRSFLDTGNELREPVTNLPCIIVEKELLREIHLIEEEIYYINYSTISDNGKLRGFKCDEIWIKNSKGNFKIKGIICLGENKLSRENDYQALLPRGIL